MNRFNSTIKQKMCKCGCGKLPKLGYGGYVGISHMPEDMQNQDKWKSKAISHRKAVNLSVQTKKISTYSKEVNADKTAEMDKLEYWFVQRRKEMTGFCAECSKGTNRNNDKYYKWSICHIAPKALVPSVATNEYNWIELCQQHHQEFDNTFDKAKDMMVFGEVKMKFQLFKHLIPPEELRKINPHLLSDF